MIVTTWHLEMRSPAELRPKRLDRADVALVAVPFAWPELNRWLYATVGADWAWTDRLSWNRARWLAYLDRPELRTWLLTVAGVPAGYCEMELQGSDVELVYFGLLPPYVGQGLGGHLLTLATEHAWAWGASRVWLHTCSLDHPAALAHYQARGYRVFREVVEGSASVGEMTPGGCHREA